MITENFSTTKQLKGIFRRLKNERNNAGISIAELSEKTGVSETVIVGMDEFIVNANSVPFSPSLEDVSHIAIALGLKLGIEKQK